MPLFGKKDKGEKAKAAGREATPPGQSSPRTMSNSASNGSVTPNSGPPPEQQPRTRPKLVFHCQQAHGSPTGVITGFTNVKELYQKIAECYDVSSSEILFCTLNTHKIDMTKLLGGQIGLDDFIFAHMKGRPKVVDIEKNEEALGLTITDNGAGYAFIKRIKDGSIMDSIEGITVGDHIEKINDQSMVGCRHFEVAKMLKEIPKGSTFSLRLVEPVKAWQNVGPPTGGSKKSGKLGTGRETLRLRSKGPASVEVAGVHVDMAIEKINSLLDNFIGIQDTELSQSIWEMGSEKENPHDFAVALDESDIKEFGFTDEFIFDLWGAITDAKQNRLKKPTEFTEQF